jgi:hypothetical protein
VNLFLCLTNYAIRHEGPWGSGCIGQVFLTSALVGGEWLASRPTGRFTLGERSWLVGPQSRSKRHGKVKIIAPPGLELRPLGHPACNQSLYRLRYPGY